MQCGRLVKFNNANNIYVRDIYGFGLEEGTVYYLENKIAVRRPSKEIKIKGHYKCIKNYKNFILFEKDNLKTSIQKIDLIVGNIIHKVGSK